MRRLFFILLISIFTLVGCSENDSAAVNDESNKDDSVNENDTQGEDVESENTEESKNGVENNSNDENLVKNDESVLIYDGFAVDYSKIRASDKIDESRIKELKNLLKPMKSDDNSVGDVISNKLGENTVKYEGFNINYDKVRKGVRELRDVTEIKNILLPIRKRDENGEIIRTEREKLDAKIEEDNQEYYENHPEEDPSSDEYVPSDDIGLAYDMKYSADNWSQRYKLRLNSVKLKKTDDKNGRVIFNLVVNKDHSSRRIFISKDGFDVTNGYSEPIDVTYASNEKNPELGENYKTEWVGDELVTRKIPESPNFKIPSGEGPYDVWVKTTSFEEEFDSVTLHFAGMAWDVPKSAMNVEKNEDNDEDDEEECRVPSYHGGCD